MYPILAQIPTPAPGTVETWLWAFAALAGLAYVLKKLFTRDPPDYKEFASKAEVERLRNELDDRLTGMSRKIDTGNHETREMLAIISSRQNKTNTALARLIGVVSVRVGVDVPTPAEEDLG